jgi:hypothetical protein
MTGYMRNGYCEVPASDAGSHSIAAVVSDEFLKFSADRGNDLRQIGLKGGCKWCLCVSRWKEAFDARGKEGDKIVPKYVESYINLGQRAKRISGSSLMPPMKRLWIRYLLKTSRSLPWTRSDCLDGTRPCSKSVTLIFICRFNKVLMIHDPIT